MGTPLHTQPIPLTILAQFHKTTHLVTLNCYTHNCSNKINYLRQAHVNTTITPKNSFHFNDSN